MLVGLLGVYRQEKVEVGYCGVGRPSTEIAGVRIPEWADAIRPQCEPCPQHAYCGEKLETTCEPGFVLTPHPLSFGGVVPLAPSCEPDSAKARRVGAVKQRAVEELREQNAKYECGEATTPEVKEPDLKKAIASKRRKNMSNQEFEDLWASALGDIQSAEEVTTGADGHGHFTLRSHSLARLPLSCALRRSLREALGRYLGPIVGCLLLVAGTAYTRHHLVSTRDTDRQAADLARVALDTLRDQAAWHAFDPQTYGENFMGVAQLRDDVLRAELSAGRRARLWERVRAKVEANSNVRSLVREGKSGDVGRVWEWVGAVGGTPERGGRRVGFAGVKKEAGEGGREEGGRRWEEGRAYY
ncbi:Inner nuclear membrane protein SRC1 [Teratosphaeria destructans]|uniref:Inner nuclear membrane protein SRC1 n=1 Tax=Teratosphaeria destructans TaxID=418781 RepID=A0A9W7W335_9PEZI|nr:Inner nuclear membrane protein SRC1 [Teratosphaeria destructans]